MKKILNLGTKVSAEDQKKILGALSCPSDPCYIWVEEQGQGYGGTCGFADIGGGYGFCECLTQLGPYTPTGGTSHCWIP